MLTVNPVPTRERLARLLWEEIHSSGRTQKDVAAQVGITEKHLSMVVQGKAGMTLYLFDQVLAELGRELVVSTRDMGATP